MSFYKRPKVFGTKGLGHGIGLSANTAVILARTAGTYDSFRPKAANGKSRRIKIFR